MASIQIDKPTIHKLIGDYPSQPATLSPSPAQAFNLEPEQAIKTGLSSSGHGRTRSS